MFTKILIANRGEIACRVAATARRLAIKTVAVYSDADANAKHVSACDEAVYIGGSAPKDSYLRWERILQAAKATGAEAVHPSYGFLSENEDFARRVEEGLYLAPAEGDDVEGRLRRGSHTKGEGPPRAPNAHCGEQAPQSGRSAERSRRGRAVHRVAWASH